MKRLINGLVLLATLLLCFRPVHARADYDPTIQRWIEMDPIGEAGGINLYGFVGNNPVSYVDPWGLNSQIVMGDHGRLVWVGPYNQTPPGMRFELWWGNADIIPPGMIWGDVDNGNAHPVPDETMGLQPSLLGEMLLPTGAGFLAKPSWLTGLKGPCPTTLMGKGIVLDGKVIAHAPIESVVSHARLAEQSGALLEAPLNGARGTLVPGAQAFTYQSTGAYLDWVIGSGNFNSAVNNITVNAVSAFVQGLK
jgi:hypothetical protein